MWAVYFLCTVHIFSALMFVALSSTGLELAASEVASVTELQRNNVSLLAPVNVFLGPSIVSLSSGERIFLRLQVQSKIR